MKKLVGENTRFIYGMGGALIAEYDGSSGNLKKEYVAGGGSMITIEPTAVNSNGTQYTTGDHLGSPRVITNSSGSVVSRHDYMPFGEELGASVGGRTTGMGFSNSGDSNRKKFTGYEHDTETGLDFAQARFYGNTQGRFTSPDPFSASAIIADPQTFNRYAYCRNNPVNSVDPSGMSAHAAMQNEGAQERRQASWQSGHDIIEQEEAWYAQNLAATYAAINEANYLNSAVASGAMSAQSAAGIAAGNPMLGAEYGEVTGYSLSAPQEPGQGSGEPTILHYWPAMVWRDANGNEVDKSPYGHIALQLSDGTYISYWPAGHLGSLDSKEVEPATNRKYFDDYYGEHQTDSRTFQIYGLDEAKIKRWWNNGEGHGKFSSRNNCADIVTEALRQGGLVPWTNNLRWSTPYDVWNGAKLSVKMRETPLQLPKIF